MRKKSLFTLAPLIALTILIASSDRAREYIAYLENIPTITQIQKIVDALGLGQPLKNPITFIDVDEETWNAWKREAQISRARLAALLDTISAGQPLAVMIDFDLSRPQAEDHVLMESLDRFATLHPGTPVLAPREILGPPGEKLSQRSTVFDKSEAIVWLSVRFKTDENFVVKAWRPYEIVCEPTPIALLSPQLYMSFHLAEGKPNNAIRNGLNAEAERRCKGASNAYLPGLPSGAERRFVFAFGDVSGPVAPLSEINQEHVGSVRRVPALLRFPAHLMLKRRINPGLVDGRIVIIGASHSDSGDIHLTPYGLMPGPMILANALALAKRSTGSDYVVSEAAVRLVMVVTLALVATLAFQFLETLPFVLTVYLLVIGVYALVGHLFNPSLAADVVVDALSLSAAFATLISGLQIRTQWRRRGWRAVLKDPDR